VPKAVTSYHSPASGRAHVFTAYHSEPRIATHVHGAARRPASVGGVQAYTRAREVPTESCALNFVPAPGLARWRSWLCTRRDGRAAFDERALASMHCARLAGLEACNAG